MQSTTYFGERFSASKAYLWPVMGRDNLEIVTYAEVAKILCVYMYICMCHSQ